jgi:hypothetical protein
VDAAEDRRAAVLKTAKYIDDKDSPCSEDNMNWTPEALASQSGEGPARISKTPSGTTQSSRKSGKDWSIIDVDARVTESNSTWWKYAWKLTLRNDGLQPALFEGQIEFQDADGFIIDTSSARNMIVPAGEEKAFTGYALITAEVGGNVKRTSAKVARVR